MHAIRRTFTAALLSLLTAAGACDDTPPAGDAVTVPSGRDVQFLDVISNAPGAEGTTARFRFVAPGLTPADSEAASADMQALCDSYALPRTTGTVPAPQQIVITLSASAVPFGQAAPEVTQFFEAYAITDGVCVWQVF